MGCLKMELLTDDMRMFFIHINDIENGVASGTFMNPIQKEEIPFRNLSDLIAKIDGMLQDFQKHPRENSPHLEPYLNHPFFSKRSRHFFFIHIYYLEYGDWQGSVRYSGCKKAVLFRGILELLRVMCEVMELQGMPGILSSRYKRATISLFKG